MEMVTVTCNCKHCKSYAAAKGITFPMSAEVNSAMHNAICTNRKGVHAMVQKAHQPPFGRMDSLQAKFGPWVA